jgi:hypothetical protein
MHRQILRRCFVDGKAGNRHNLTQAHSNSSFIRR